MNVRKSLADALDVDEEIIWRGRSTKKPLQWVIFFASVILACCLFWLGWSDSSPLVWVAPTLAKIAGTLPGLIAALFAGLMLLDRLNSKETILTSKRIFNVNRVGGLSPASGFPLDFERVCIAGASHVDFPAVTLDSGYPDRVTIAGLEEDVTLALIEFFEELKEKDRASRAAGRAEGQGIDL